MKKTTVHLIYSLPLGTFDTITIRVLRKLFLRSSFQNYKWPMPLQAPFSITYHLAQYFSNNFHVKLYDYQERVAIKPNQGDILIGHPHPDPQSLMWQALDNPLFGKKYLICPYNHSILQVGWLRPAIEKCDKYFAICGDYWFETFAQSPFADLENKIIHINMALNANEYPYLKQKFNPVRQRRFFYIGRYGSFGDEKGIGLLEMLAENIPGFSGGYICKDGHIAGWKRISKPTSLTPEFMANVAEKYDFFINMSRADAQATTVLEAMSWGFPVACTKETGYSEESLFLLDSDNIEQNSAIIEHMQNLPDKELHRISRINRALAETRYNWQHFTDVIKEHIEV